MLPKLVSIAGGNRVSPNALSPSLFFAWLVKLRTCPFGCFHASHILLLLIGKQTNAGVIFGSGYANLGIGHLKLGNFDSSTGFFGTTANIMTREENSLAAGIDKSGGNFAGSVTGGTSLFRAKDNGSTVIAVECSSTAILPEPSTLAIYSVICVVSRSLRWRGSRPS